VKLLHPKVTKLKRTFYPRQLRIKNYSDNIIFGDFAIKINKNCILTLTQLESLKKTILKIFKKSGKVWFRAFPHFFITKKPLEVRMGNGKGNFDTWAVCLPAGFIVLEFSLFEKENLNINLLKLTHNLISKIGISCKITNKNDLF
jgi:large subunit ribosomal protein L16